MKAALLALISISLSSCISVKVPLGPAEKVKNLRYSAPAKPFVELSTEEADFAWISESTGNTISILSECQPSRLKPKEIATDTIRAIDKYQIIKSEETLVTNHPAYMLTAQGLVDSHPVMISIVSVKTDDCFVTLTYGGLEKNFGKESDLFQKVQSSLVVP